METVYKQAAARKRKRESAGGNRNTERRRLAQLLISLFLFAIVFLSRNAFPKFCSNIEALLTKDIHFSETFSAFESGMTNHGHLLRVLKNLTEAPYDSGVLEVESPAEPDEPEVELVEVDLLSKMSQVGLSYYKENGLREYSYRNEVATEPVEKPLPEIVTAVAQAYNSAGEALPRNVSYEYYELGLEQTVVPVVGEITSGFEYRTSPISGKREFHLALDIAAEKGTEIAAFADGVVRYIGESDEFGLYFMIDHDNGVATFYAHCSKLLVRKGDTVSCGQTVALVGNTGNATGYHLHFTIEKDNIRLNPAYYVNQ